MYHINAPLNVCKQILQQKTWQTYEFNDAVNIFTCNTKNTPASNSEKMFNLLTPARYVH